MYDIPGRRKKNIATPIITATTADILLNPEFNIKPCIKQTCAFAKLAFPPETYLNSKRRHQKLKNTRSAATELQHSLLSFIKGTVIRFFKIVEDLSVVEDSSADLVDTQNNSDHFGRTLNNASSTVSFPKVQYGSFRQK